MPTTADYLNDLIEQKNVLAQNISSCGVETGSNEKFNTLVTKVNEVYTSGINDEKIRVWDIRQNSGKRINYLYAFAGTTWYDDIYEPIYPIVASENATSMFNYSRVTDTKVPIDLSGSVRNTGNMFDNSKIATIRKLIVSETTPSIKFTNVSNLENITVEGVIGNDWTFTGCDSLTHDSLMSIINALKNYVTYESRSYINDSNAYVANNPVIKTEFQIENIVIGPGELKFDCFEPNTEYTNRIIVYVLEGTEEDFVNAKTIFVHENRGFTITVPIVPTETHTLTIGTTNLAKLTDEEKAIATEKGWILA